MNPGDITPKLKQHISEFMEQDAAHLERSSRMATSFDGMDSMKQFEMIVYLEECFKVEFEESYIDRLETFGDLVDYIQHLLAQK